jgi:hypothetical protein
MAKFCSRCGQELQAGARFCGECGTPVPGVAADPEEPTQAAGPAAGHPEDFFADWNDDLARGLPAVPKEAEASRSDEARTESIPAVRPSDTAVLPPVQEPYLPPGSARPAAPAGPPPGPALAFPPPGETVPARQGFPVGAAFSLLGAVAVIVSALLPWGRNLSLGGPLIASVSPRDIPFEALIRPGRPGTDPSLGLVLLGAGTLGAVVALLTMVLPVLKFLRRLIGLATLAIPGLFVFRVIQAALAAGLLDQVLSVLGAGVYVAVAGAFTQMVAGKWFRR